MQVRVVCVIGLFMNVAIWSTVAQSDRALAAAPRLLAEFPVKGGDAPWTVEAVIDGTTYQMLLDTGTGGTILDKIHRHLLGKAIATMKLHSDAGTLERLEMLAAPPINMGLMALHTPRGALCLDLAFCSRMCPGTKIDGILGMDLLRQTIFNVDRDAEKIRFFSTGPNDPGLSLPIVWSKEAPYSVPQLRATLPDGTSHLFFIDAGYNGDMLDGLFTGSLEPGIYDDLIRSKLLIPISLLDGVTHHTVGGSLQSDGAGVMNLSLGPYNHERLIFFRGERVSRLGRGYLSRYSITFDFPRERIYLRPSELYNRTDFYDLSGMRVAKSSGLATVTLVRKNGPAASAGIATGDVISSINGQIAANLPELAIRKMFAERARISLELDSCGVRRHAVLDLTQADQGPASLPVDGPRNRQNR